jgi:polyphenol oxidase
MHRAETWIFRPEETPPRLLVAYSGRGAAPPEHNSPTAFLARSFASALGHGELPIARATQVHGARVVTVGEVPPRGEVLDAGECDILATSIPGVALAVQTADCVPILLAGGDAIGAAHAGWRGAALDVAGKAVAALESLGAGPGNLRVWIGPSIGPCCYEVGGEVAVRFAGDFLRASSGVRYRLDLTALNRAQLVAAGVPPGNISVHPACTRCGGEKYASYRRDGAASGRMIALVARLS